MIPSEPTTAIQVDALRENLFSELPFSFQHLGRQHLIVVEAIDDLAEKGIGLEDHQLVKDLLREPVREPQ